MTPPAAGPIEGRENAWRFGLAILLYSTLGWFGILAVVR